MIGEILMTRGLYLGKFMPVHTGHEYVMNYAAELVDELVIVLGSRENDPLDITNRSVELMLVCPENAHVEYLHKDLPQLPEEDPENFWDIWKKELTDLVGEVDMVFGGEDYINTLAKVLNAEPMIIDRTQYSIDISATKIRDMSLLQRWQYIPKSLRPSYKLNVCVLGPESTGKSVLTRDLANVFNESVYTHEYGREYALKGTREWVREDFNIIRARQEALRKVTEEACEMICFSDTDTLQTNIWETFLLKGFPSNRFLEYNPIDLYLLLSPNVPFIQDGERYHEELKTRQTFYYITKEMLDNLGFNYVEVKSSYFSNRLTYAIEAVEKLLENK